MSRHSSKKRRSLSDDVEEIVIGPLLQSTGFHKYKSTWNRILPELTHVVDLQRHSTSTAECASVTLNVGVWNRQVWTICSGKSPPEFVNEWECFPRFRIGEIVGAFSNRSKDLWWTLVSGSDMTTTYTAIREAITTNVLPFFDDLRSLADVKQFCDTTRFRMLPAERMCLAILSFIEGDKSQCESILKSFDEQGLEAWRPRANEVRERLGVALPRD